MKHRALALTLLASLTGLAGAAHADKLDDIKQAGVVRIAVFDSNPPFGYIDPQSKKLVGYDVDVADAIGKALGVKWSCAPPTRPTAFRCWCRRRLT